MKTPFIIFNLLTIHIVDDIWIELGNIDLDRYEGSFLSIHRTYDGIWKFDFFYYQIFKYLYLDWKEEREEK